MNMEQNYRLAIDDEEYPIGFDDPFDEEDEEEYWDDPFDEDDDIEDDGPFYDPQDGNYW